MHNQPSIAPVRAPVDTVPAQNVTTNILDASADRAAGVRAAQGRDGGAAPARRTLTLPIKVSMLLSSAAKDAETRKYIDPKIEAKTQAMVAVIEAMLYNHGCDFDGNVSPDEPFGQYRHDKAHNRFERERAELNAEHFKALVSLQEQLTVATLACEMSLTLAKKQWAKLQQQLDARSPAADKVQESMPPPGPLQDGTRI